MKKLLLVGTAFLIAALQPAGAADTGMLYGRPPVAYALPRWLSSLGPAFILAAMVVVAGGTQT